MLMSDVYYATLQDHGRVVIPAAVRRTLGLGRGAEVVLRVENEAVVLTGADAAVRRFQQAVRQHVPADESLVDDLLAGRRAEAARE